jgi:cytidylate kinase
VARRAAELLDYEWGDKDLITEVAKEANVPESEVEKFDERSQSAVRRFIHGLITPSQSVPVPPAMLWGLEFPYEVSAALLADDAALSEERHLLDQRDYLKFLQAAVNRLYKRDRMIIVGRGGQAILGNKVDTIHIRTVAPMDTRIEVVMERRGIGTVKEAKDIILGSDKRRSAYIKDNYGIDWNDITNYHLTINTGKTSEEMAARLIQQAARHIDAGESCN